MRMIALASAIAVLLAAGVTAKAAPISADGMRGNYTPIQLVQEKKQEKKKETMTEKVKETTEKVKASAKRTWKRIAGYKFEASCLLTGTRICRETGKDKEAARAKCQSQYPLCVVSDAK